MSDFEQLQIEGMESYEVPAGWIPTVSVEITEQPRFKDYKVSAAGQMTIPATARERWGLKEGGTVNVFDIEDAVFVFPEQIHPDTAREIIHLATLPADEQLPPRTVTHTLSMRGILFNIIGEYE